LGYLGYTTTVYGLDQQGGDLWAYYNDRLYHYAIVPEPTGIAWLAPMALLLTLRTKRRANHARQWVEFKGTGMIS
jgi:hypothetical protein